MEKLLNLIIDICNWYENTTVRRDDPIEVADIKKSERGLVRTSIYAVFIVFLMVLIDSKLTLVSSKTASMVIVPFLSQVAIALSWALLATALVFMYYLIRIIYCYPNIGHYD